MADSTLNDITKMKVVDLRKELKSRGLSYAGDKSELVARLQGAISQEDHTDITLDSDEIDSDGVLEDEDDKSQNDILDESAVDNLNEELALADHSPPKPVAEPKPQRTLKRKIAADTSKTIDKKEEGSKKIVLNRTTSITTTKSTEEKDNNEVTTEVNPVTNSSNKIKITCDMDAKTRLEMRAKRFGLPVKMSDAERKEARKQRFNKNSITAPASNTETSASLSENLEKLRKRAERFGQNVSSIMTVIENKEKLEKRKEKFNVVK